MTQVDPLARQLTNNLDTIDQVLDKLWEDRRISDDEEAMFDACRLAVKLNCTLAEALDQNITETIQRLRTGHVNKNLQTQRRELVLNARIQVSRLRAYLPDEQAA
jgi:hypothetical protein